MTLPLSFVQSPFLVTLFSVRTRFSRFLLLLMMLALPVQTFASAAMLGCSFSHQPAVEPMAMVGEIMADCHEPVQPESPPVQHNCNHCTACALASVLPIPVASSAAITPASIRFLSQPAASFSGFVPSGPERPPRNFLA